MDVVLDRAPTRSPGLSVAVVPAKVRSFRVFYKFKYFIVLFKYMLLYFLK